MQSPSLRGSWGSEGTIVTSTSATGLGRVSAAGGELEILGIPDSDKGELQYLEPTVLLGGKAVLFTVQRKDDFQIAVFSLETGEKKIVLEGGRSAQYSPTEHLVYGHPNSETLLAVPFDLTSLEVTGDPVTVLQGVRDGRDYVFSEDGTLVYVPGGFAGQERRSLIWVDREGRTESVSEIQRTFSMPRLSPDGQRVAFRTSPEGTLWSYEMARGILTPLTFGNRVNRSPIWTPDGKRITYSVTGSGIFWMPADGSAEAEQLTVTESINIHIPNSWSLQGVLAYADGLPENGDIWTLSPEGERQPQEFLVTNFNERHSMFSADGRWIAFTSDRSGQDEVYVKAYSGEGGIIAISTDGGNQPLWARNGRELFYRNGDQMMVVAVQTGPTFKAETPRLLFEGRYLTGPFNWQSNYDISPDGQRFLMIKQVEVGTQINVVLNWFEELKRLVPTDN